MSETKYIRVDIKTKITVPSTPNFIMVGDISTPIKEVPLKVLEEIIEAWSAELLTRAGHTQTTEKIERENM